MTFTLTDNPQANHTLATDQPLMRANNSFFATALGKDHQVVVGQSANATPGLGTLGAGRHMRVSFVTDEGANPALNSADNVESMLWSHNEELFFQNNSGGPYQLTTSQSGAGPQARFGTNTNYSGSLSGGWSFIPGALVLQYGSITQSSSSTRTITFPIAFPSGNPPFSIQVTPFRASSDPGGNQHWVIDSSVSDTAFDIRNNGGHTFGFYWVAIGN